MMINEYGAVGGIRISRGSPKYSKNKNAPVPLSSTNPT
jgi:hypothetical protein